MTGIDLVAYALPLLIFLLGAYVVRQARRSRENELSYKLRKCHVALHDAEQSLDNTVRYYKSEIHRLHVRLGEVVSADPSSDGIGGAGLNGDGAGWTAADGKFRQAKKAFARLYHPDRVAGDDAEKHLRTELFKEFWDELERIERRGP